MNTFFQKFVKVCPKTGRVKKFIVPKGFYRVLFPLIGLAALVWILIRVIPKPSRAQYPCIKAATPFATGFIVYVATLIASAIAFAKSKKKIYLTPYLIFFGLAVFGFSDTSNITYSDPLPTAVLDANVPMGVPKGIFPGRVVWVHDANATNENCNPMEKDHSYFAPENSNQDVIDKMVSKAIQELTGKTSDVEAWDAIFKFHNNTRGKGQVGYKAGEKIFIKINATSGWSGNYDNSDLSKVYSSRWGGVNSYYGLSETSPEFMLAVLRQLVYKVNVAQEDIYIGDPMKFIYKHVYDYLHAEFPNLHYLDHTGHTNIGRELAVKGTTPLIKYSDRGTVLVYNGQPVTEDKLYKIFEDAEYILNLPQMKGHVRGGVTMFAKNNFGSHIRDGANHLHNGLMKPGEVGLSARPGNGLYRVQVDLMGHEILGKKILVYLMEALWSTDHELNPPAKWQMAPFNNDWTSSVFASLDPVAIESVGYDFVRSEFTTERYPNSTEDVVNVIQMEGVCDYLRQAADPANWPAGIQYDPENDGTILTSLGVHEHWNNAIDKQYSKNLGTGNGIELIKIEGVSSSLAAPTSLSATVKNSSDVELIWQDNTSDETGFVVERKENAANAVYVVLDTVDVNQTSFVDSGDKLVSSYYYRIKAINATGSSDYTSEVLVKDLTVVGVEEELISTNFKLNQNYPNPFNPTTTISFSLNKTAEVKLEIYDALGRLINVLISNKLSQGYHSIVWNGTNYTGASVGSGIYIYKITVKDGKELFSQSQKMNLVK